MIRGQVCAYIEDGNAVIAWSSPNDAGFQFETCGRTVDASRQCVPRVCGDEPIDLSARSGRSRRHTQSCSSTLMHDPGATGVDE
jgi:hypothetical protein